MSRFAQAIAVAVLFFSCLPRVSAETILSQWNWNSTISGSYNKPSAGTVLSGTALGYGQSAPSIPLSTILANGAAIDPGTVITGTTWNRAASINPPLLTAANSSVGVMFHAPTTGMNAGEAVKLSWSQTVGFRSSRYWQLLVSTSGTAGAFSAPSGGTGSAISQFINGYNSGTAPISGTATVNVSSAGVIDFRTINGNWISQAVTTTSTNPLPTPLVAGWVDNISYTLPTGQGYENNANFAFAIVGLWDPNLSATSGTTGLVSSFSGLDSTNLITGYNRSVASGGSMRLDLMTVTAVPEPATIVLVGTAALISGAVTWRRRKRA